MKTESEFIREYFPEVVDINSSESIKVLPLTIADMLLEYAQKEVIGFEKWKEENYSLLNDVYLSVKYRNDPRYPICKSIEELYNTWKNENAK